MLMPAIVALARRFELAPESTASRPQAQMRRRGLRVGNLNLLVPHDCGGELIEDPRLYTLPRTRSWCKGLLNLRGRLIPAFDLHDYLHLKTGHSQWWIGLGSGDDAVVFGIDSLPVMLTLANEALVQATVIPEPLRPFVSNAYQIEGALWLEFDYRSFFHAIAQRVAA